MLEAGRDELVPALERLPDRRGDRLGAIGIGPDGGIARGLVHRLVRRGDDGRAAAIASMIGIPKPSKRDG